MTSMALFKEIGNAEIKHEEREIEWKVTNFFSVIETATFIQCPPFFFADVPWFLQLKSKSEVKPGFMSLFLLKEKKFEFSVGYNFALRTVDGSAELLKTGILDGDLDWSDACHIKLSEVKRRKSEVVPSHVLTITCTLKRQTTHFSRPKILDIPKLKKLMDLDTLSENFKTLFLNKESCDTTLLVMDKEYKAHKTVLMARSSVFFAMFLHETSEKQTGIVNIADCDPESFEEFLEFLYSGKLEKPSTRSALHLYETSEKYDVQKLKIFCSGFLMQNLTVEYLCDAVILADKYDDTKLLSAAQCFFNENLSSVFVTSAWNDLLNNNRRLANKLLLEMSSNVKVVKTEL